MNKANLEAEFLWGEFVKIYMKLGTTPQDYEPIIEKLLEDEVDRVQILRKACTGPEKIAALHFAYRVPVSELIQLFPELIFQAIGSEGIVESVRNLILSLPRDWVLENIETFTRPLLENGTYIEYRRFLELYYELDYDLTRNLAYRAAKDSDPDIKEAGQDFLEKLNQAN